MLDWANRTDEPEIEASFDFGLDTDAILASRILSRDLSRVEVMPAEDLVRGLEKTLRESSGLCAAATQ